MTNAEKYKTPESRAIAFRSEKCPNSLKNTYDGYILEAFKWLANEASSKNDMLDGYIFTKDSGYDKIIAHQLAVANSLKKMELVFMYELKLRELYRDYPNMVEMITKGMNQLNQAIDMAFDADAK